MSEEIKHESQSGDNQRTWQKPTIRDIESVRKATEAGFAGTNAAEDDFYANS